MKEEYIGDIYMITFVDYKKLEYLTMKIIWMHVKLY